MIMSIINVTFLYYFNILLFNAIMLLETGEILCLKLEYLLKLEVLKKEIV